MKKKLSLIITAGALSALLIVGGTLAWFTDTKDATNTFQMGNVAIDLLENGNTDYDGGLEFDNIVPGDELDKEVKVMNRGSVDSYIRLLLTTGYTEGTPQIDGQDLSYNLLELLNINSTNWTLHSDGYYYYNGALASGATSELLFDTVTIPTSWGNEMALADFFIDIEVEAIQARNIYDPGTGTFSVNDLATAWSSTIAPR